MRKVHTAAVILLCLVQVMTPAVACYWDSETIAMERQRFPEILELMTGKFLRHSDAYYEWRIQDRTQQLETESTPELYDDLAVAYEKLGDHEKAVELMQKKEQLFPGRYETYANLGTFYIHDGQLQLGLEYIEKAIEINPDAHFGREIYQKRLVEYVLFKKVDGKTVLPLSFVKGDQEGEEVKSYRITNFMAFLNEHEEKGDASQEFEAALKGIKGMLRFGNYQSPILLEALGDALLYPGRMAEASPPDEAKQLATRAYLLASYAAEEEGAKAKYYELAEEALLLQTKPGWAHESLELDVLEEDLKEELKHAEEWYARLVANEKQWFEQGLNLDDEYAKTYYVDPVQENFVQGAEPVSKWFVGLKRFLLACVGIVACVVFYFSVRLFIYFVKWMTAVPESHFESQK